MLGAVDSCFDKLQFLCSLTKHTFLGIFMCWAAVL